MSGGDLVDHVLSLSYGKDSLACLAAAEQIGLRIDRIVHAEVWATDTVQADLPPMVEFKRKADEIIFQRYGIRVEHIRSQYTYESYFYKKRNEKSKFAGCINGFPMQRRNWCVGKLKTDIIDRMNKGVVSLIGIAADEPERIKRHIQKPNIRLPLVEAGWTESMCRKWCEENDLLSPIYTTATRGGCWFCHNQGVEQLRLLRKNYPEYWAMLLKWDKDSPVTFKPDGHTVHDYDRRFRMEDDDLIPSYRTFRWEMLENPPDIQLSLFEEGL
jgi:3'-phosphoadenosine 5'-phosphosulfate sulfotransferase (PAPS reductase)/FAD synthetase